MKALDAIPTRREGAAALAAHRGRRVVGQPAAGGDSVDGSAAGRGRGGGTVSWRSADHDSSRTCGSKARAAARKTVCQRPEKSFDFNARLEAGLPLERIEIIQKQSFRLISDVGFYPGVFNWLRQVCQFGFDRFANLVPLTFSRTPC
jgi:hypothetical protein